MFFKDKSSITHHSFDSMYKICKKKNINIYEKLYKKHNYFDSDGNFFNTGKHIPTPSIL